jgi:hypothetical protein
MVPLDGEERGEHGMRIGLLYLDPPRQKSNHQANNFVCSIFDLYPL